MEAQQINWEHGLYDAMSNVCNYLNLKDLHNLTKVSKTWRDAALREKAKRFYIQRMRLNYPTNLRVSMLDVKPHISLLIYDCKLEEPLFLNDPPFCMYKDNQLPRKVIALQVKKYLTTQDVEFDGRKDQRKLNTTGNCEILGLFFPCMRRRVRVHVAWENSDVLRTTAADRIHYLAEELGLNDEKRPKSTILLFTHSRRGFEIANTLIRSSIQEDRETLWLGMFQERLITVRCNLEDYQTNRGVVAMSISGPNVQSWNAFINSRLPRDEIERKLHELKGKVTRGRHCTGLMYSPATSSYGDSDELMRNVKRIFPGIPFTGLFNSKLWSGADAFFEKPQDYFFRAMNFISMVIISYD